MSIRVKWVLALVCLTAVASGAVGFLSYRLTAAQLESELRDSLEEAASTAAARITRAPVARRALPPRAPGNGIQLQVLTGAGRAIAPEGSAGEGSADQGSAGIPVTTVDLSVAEARRPGVEVFSTARIDGEAHRVITVSLGDRRGAVQAARSVAESDRVLARLRARIIVVTVAVMGVGAVAGVLIGGSVTRRLLGLVGVAEAVADTGQIEATVPAEGSDEVARLGRAFNEMLGALARSEAEQARLVEDAGHELRTPMTSLRNNIYILRHYAELDDEARQGVLADLERETEELSALIEDVLAVSAGRTDEEPVREVDIGDLVRSVAERTAGRWDRQARVQVPEGFTARVRSRQVSRAVRNLVDNACKFSPEGSPVDVILRAHVAERTNGDPAEVFEIEVADRGGGFEEADLANVFARFHRSEAARGLPGSGLGLSIVASVAATHGGEVHAANREGGGARVVLRLRGQPDRG